MTGLDKFKTDMEASKNEAFTAFLQRQLSPMGVTEEQARVIFNSAFDSGAAYMGIEMVKQLLARQAKERGEE